MLFDVATLQKLYGANTSYKTGDDTYTLPTTETIGTGWECIWDCGGTVAAHLPRLSSRRG